MGTLPEGSKIVTFTKAFTLKRGSLRRSTIHLSEEAAQSIRDESDIAIDNKATMGIMGHAWS